MNTSGRLMRERDSLMPLMIAEVNRERTVAGLVRNLFDIRGEGSAELRRRAEEALVRANPRLIQPNAVRRGVAVVVPEVVGLNLTDRVRGLDSENTGPVTERLEKDLQDLGALAETGLAAAKTQSAETVKHLKDKQLIDQISKEAPDLGKRIPELQESAETRRKEIDRRVEGIDRLLEMASEDLARFSRQLTTRTDLRT